MMDPLTALGLAANIAQFIDFGISIFREAKEIKDAGHTVSSGHLASLAADFGSINATLKRDLAPNLAPEGCSEDEKCLLDDIASKSPKRNIWESVLAAIRTRWSKDKIEQLVRKLTDYRGQLTLRLLLVINNQYKHKEDSHASLKNEIIEAVSLNSQLLSSEINQRSSEVITAILTTRDGTSRAIGTRKKLVDSTKETRAAVGPSNLKSIKFSKEHGTSDETDGFSPGFTTKDISSSYEERILNALHFRGINERYSSISEAHKQTFEWIWADFSDLSGGGYHGQAPRWDHLGQWLYSSQEKPQRCYWISGKAGSGKSSLMKYLQGDSRTVAHLKDWAGGADLLAPSFYFWYAGTELQRSHAGLLRSILLEILSKRHDLIPALFPDTCRSIISGELFGRIEVSYSELKSALSRLIDNMPSDLKICFLLDGLDEYTGDLNELCDLLLGLCNCDSIKILVSSRPVPVCVSRFDLHPKLRLQDLTRNDILHYVLDNLGSHPLCERMELGEPGITQQLVKTVTSRAQGVFLWIVLVVKNLIRGLQNYDTPAELLREVDRLPSDLEELYEHMLGSMSPSNQVQGSKLIQIVLRNVQILLGSDGIRAEYPLTLLQLSYAEEGDYESCLKSPVAALSPAQCRWRCEATEGRLRSRCCGLIEVQDFDLDDNASRTRTSVGLLHRTVVEFFQDDFVWKRIAALTSGSDFDPDLALLSSTVSELKAIPVDPRSSLSTSLATNCVVRMMFYYGHLHSHHPRRLFHELYLPELRRALVYHWHDSKIFVSPQQELSAIEESTSRAQKTFQLSFPHDIILSLDMQAPSEVVYDSIYAAADLDPTQTRNDHGAYLLIHFVEERQPRLRLSMAKSVKYLRVNPNKRIAMSGAVGKLWNYRWPPAFREDGSRDWSLWEFMLHYCFSLMDDPLTNNIEFANKAMSTSLLSVLDGLRELHADVNIGIMTTSRSRLKGKREDRQISALSVILPVLNKIWSTFADSKAPLDEIAGLSCSIEHGLREKGAKELDSLGEPGKGIPSMEASKTSSHPTKLRGGRFHAFMESLGSVREPEASKPKPATKGSQAKSKSVEESPRPSPWFEYQSHAQERQLQDRRQNESNSNPEQTAARREKQWHLTHRSRRTGLLSSEEQTLACELAKERQTAKEKRALLHQLLSLPPDRQKEILECMETIKLTQSANESEEV
ncbi:MAG: hypothetical protein M1821_003469 [Bathelium mastoideum]|nr:MAG: hypothetical protein M1821_003469 [Bathelium mastoideum]